ncbi:MULTISPECIES: LolA family protein [Vibrio]|uniref:Outer membrane lipoprotein carrier protein LolA n=1 Tax=Vibrio algicola TaxID=2662262 RepID=A0A5Q0TFM8_9VIBR|nr:MULTISPECIES: outer membrane lipoprotein carrier protein LolA [Vibrio]MBD1575179.1 outer membrane lipoprotein carrier protein LolA [Vibrio sp. S11_S32]
MRNKIGLLLQSVLILMISLMTIPAQAITLDQLQTKLAQHPIVRGDFTQTRSMKMFDAPLESSGQFLLSEKQGLWWQQSQPFPVSLVLTQDKLSQKMADQPAQVLAKKDNPMVFYFSHIFLSLFQGDTKTLTEQFKLDLSSNDKHWTLVLTPKAAPLNKVFASITIQGGDYIDSVLLQEVRGDKSDMQFSQQTNQPNALNPTEQDAFRF